MPDSTVTETALMASPVFPAYSQYGAIDDALPLLETMFNESPPSRVSPRFADNPDIGKVIAKINDACTSDYINSSQHTDKSSMVTVMPKHISSYVAGKLLGECASTSAAQNECTVHSMRPKKDEPLIDEAKKVNAETYDSDGWVHIDPVCNMCQ